MRRGLMPRWLRLVAVQVLLIPASTARVGQGAEPSAAHDDHWRIETERGAVHVWRPAEYDAETAGTVIYVHGHGDSADSAWADHRLADQFRASRINATFIVPEAPAKSGASVVWTSLDELIGAAETGGGIIVANERIVVVGHSGAWLTLGEWLGAPSVRHVVLLDALYGYEDRFRQWITEEAEGAVDRRMTIVADRTRPRARILAAQVPGSRKLATIPRRLAELEPVERRARLLYLRSQYGHMEIVESGMVIPVLLRRTRLPRL